MAKTSGAEFLLFYNDPAVWAEGFWHEDEECLINGESIEDWSAEAIKPDDLIELKGGAVFDADANDVGSMEKLFLRWKKSQTTTQIVVEIDKTKLDELKASIKALKGKVIS